MISIDVEKQSGDAHGIQAADMHPTPQNGWEIRLLHTPEEMRAVEELSLLVWPGSELDVVPGHLLLTVAHNGGLVAGAFAEGRLVGFVFGFLGLDSRVHPPRLKHCSHQLGVHPDYRNSGLGFALKRFQWQFVRAQGLEQVTWTYDPLLSRNAHLNIAKLGVVCNTYLRDVYGELRDGLNVGLPSDRFQVDWWVNSKRVMERMSGGTRHCVGWANYLASGAQLVIPAPQPPELSSLPRWDTARLWLVEIPTDFLALKAIDPALALTWRLATRQVFESLFEHGFVVTDFVYQPGPQPRAAYVLSRGPFHPDQVEET